MSTTPTQSASGDHEHFDLTFEGALCAIQLDTHVVRSFDDTAKGPPQFVYESGVIETGTVSNIVLRGGAVRQRGS